ncbi:MAG TPA: hypothetical protein VH371_08865 [Candidatus Limnocylindrales bacterium]
MRARLLVISVGFALAACTAAPQTSLLTSPPSSVPSAPESAASAAQPTVGATPDTRSSASPTALVTEPPTESPEPAPTGYSVHIANGLHPKWSADAAAAWMIHWISLAEQQYGRVIEPARILSVEAMRGHDVPRAISGAYNDLPIAWVVHANGTFVNEHGPSVYNHWFYTEGWQVFDDAGEAWGEALRNPVGQVVTAPPVTPHPSGACPLKLNIVNDYYVDVSAMINDDLGVTVEAGKSYLVNEWELQGLVPPPPPWHVVLSYTAANVEFFDTTVYQPDDVQLTITADGVAEEPYDPQGPC